MGSPYWISLTSSDPHSGQIPRSGRVAGPSRESSLIRHTLLRAGRALFGSILAITVPEGRNNAGP